MEIALLIDRVSKLETALQKTAPRAFVPTEEDCLLDRIARGMAKKPFAKLNPLHQDAVRSIAERMKTDGVS